MICSRELRKAGKSYPRTCPTCRLGPCTRFTEVRIEELDALRAERDNLREENTRLGLAFHHAINSPKGVVPAGFDDFYEPEKHYD